MKKRILIFTFLLIAIIQISVPVYMIAKHETALRNGRQFKFRTAPVDPYDAFRGRYVSIRIENDSISVPEDTEFFRNQKVYVFIEEDSEGFAEMTGISSQPPKTGDYLATKVGYIDAQQNDDRKVYVRIPFDRYYMEEEAAPAAEKAYSDNPGDAYLTVRILSGFAVAEQLYISGQPIEEYLKKEQ
ncbi:MAG: GDYXXLXY domain-containing protein [Clostridia bacterium]